MTLILNAYDEEAVRARAYQYWLEEGQPHGRHDIHWQWALREVLAKAEPVVAPAIQAFAAPVADLVGDVTLIDGIGPKIAAQLAGKGITTVSQIAAMNSDDLSVLDSQLGLRGRGARDGWIVQARELLAGSAPRAKVDQAKAAVLQ